MANAIRCRSCGRRIGWSIVDHALRTSVTCSQWCAEEIAATPTEDRTDQWIALNWAAGLSPLSIGRLYGVAHSQVYKALDRATARRR